MKLTSILLSVFVLMSCASNNPNNFSSSYLLERCSKFDKQEWSLIFIPDDLKRSLNQIESELRFGEHQAWFENGKGRYGLCEFSGEDPNPRGSCDSNYSEFAFEDNNWVVKNESITICSSAPY